MEEINYGGGSPLTAINGGTEGGTSALPAVIAGSAAVPVAVPTAAGTRTLKERLTDLKELLAEDMITQDEFDTRRKEILAEV